MGHMRLTESTGDGAFRTDWYSSDDGRFEVCVRRTEQRRRTEDWARRGLVPRPMDAHLVVETYFFADGGSCLGLYNPTERTGGFGRVIDYAWVLEDTPENRDALVAEAERMYLNDIRK